MTDFYTSIRKDYNMIYIHTHYLSMAVYVHTYTIYLSVCMYVCMRVWTRVNMIMCGSVGASRENNHVVWLILGQSVHTCVHAFLMHTPHICMHVQGWGRLSTIYVCVYVLIDWYAIRLSYVRLRSLGCSFVRSLVAFERSHNPRRNRNSRVPVEPLSQCSVCMYVYMYV